MTVQENKEIITQMFKDLSSGDPQSYYKGLHEDVKYTIAGNSMFSGAGFPRDKVIASMDMLLSMLDGPFNVEIIRLIGEDDWIAMEAIPTATTKTGRKYHGYLAAMFQLRDGKIINAIEYLDAEAIKAALVPEA